MFAVPSQAAAATVASDGSAHDHLASSTLLTNLCHVTDISSIAWRTFHLPSADHLVRSLALQPPASVTAVSAFYTPLFRAQLALRSLWGTAAAANDGLLYSLQQHDSGAPTASSALILFVCHLRSTSSTSPKTLAGEERLSLYAADADQLSVPLARSARLSSASCSSSVLSLLSAALCEAVTVHRGGAETALSVSSPSLRFILVGSSLCAAILPAPSPALSPPTRHVLNASSTAAVQPSLPAASRPAASAAVLPPVVSPSAYLSPPDTSQLSLPSPNPSEAVDMVDDITAVATPVTHSPRTLPAEHKPAIAQITARLLCSLPSAADADSHPLPPLPSYLARFTHDTHKESAYRSPHFHRSSVGGSDEYAVQPKPDLLADLALSVNTFPSLSSLSSSTRRSLAIVSADDSAEFNTAPILSIPAYTLQSADSQQLLGPPPLSAVASSALSPNTPYSMPALSPFADDENKQSPRCVDSGLSTGPAETVQPLPFSPWAVDRAHGLSDVLHSDRHSSGPGSLETHFMLFLHQQSLAPLSPAFILSTPAAVSTHAAGRASSHWTTVQSWLSGCAQLARLFSQCRPSPLLGKQLSLPAFDQLERHPALNHSLAPSSTSSSTPVSTLPLVTLPAPRLVFGFESELRDVPASALSVYAQSSFRPAITAKDAVYVIAMPHIDAAASTDDKPVDVWFDALSAAYENGGLGRHRPLSRHGRSGVLKLKSIYDVLKERAESSVRSPATPASPMDVGTGSSAASPRSGASTMILLSSEEPSTQTYEAPLSVSMALHCSAAPDGMRRYYQSIIAALIAELDAVSKGQGAEQLDRFDALVLYIVVDDQQPLQHDASHMSDYFACLNLDRHNSASFAAALIQLGQMNLVVRLLPSSTLLSFSSSTLTSLSLSVHSSIRRMLDRVDSDSDIELPKHVEQLYEPVTYLATKRMEGKDDAVAQPSSDAVRGAPSGTSTLVCVWTVRAGRLLACACDERGQVMEPFVSESGTASISHVWQCWGQCVVTVWIMVKRCRGVRLLLNVQLIELTDDTTEASTSTDYERDFATMLSRLGYNSTATTTQPGQLTLMPQLAESLDSFADLLGIVTVCSVQWDAAFSVLALRAGTASSVSTSVPTAASSSSASVARQPLVVEGINSASTLASYFLSLPPHTCCSPTQRRVPLASGLLFLHRAADVVRSTLSRPVHSPLPAHTGTPLLLSLHDQWVSRGLDASSTATAQPPPSHVALLATVAEQLQRLSFVSIPLMACGEEDEDDSATVVGSGAVPLPVCIVQRLARLLSSRRVSV